MLDKLFGSKLRLNLIVLFLTKPERVYALREITKASIGRTPAVMKELKVLDKLDFISQQTDKRWRINANFILYSELRSLVLKGQLLLEKNLIQKLEKMGSLKLVLLTGRFVGLPHLPTDIFLVGKIRRQQLARLIKKYERGLGSEINYTIMSYQEFKYRRDITDRFLYEILENKHLIFIDKL